MGHRNVGGHMEVGKKGGEKIFLLCVNTHQAESTMEVALGNQVDRMSQPDDVSQPL